MIQIQLTIIHFIEYFLDQRAFLHISVNTLKRK